MINSGFTALNDINCASCATKNYNSSGEWVKNGTSKSKSLFTHNYGDVVGKSVIDSLCLSPQFGELNECYSTKNEDHYEFFAIQNTTTPNDILGKGEKDGGLGLAPGSNGFKSYVEYLIERNLITYNTIFVYYDEYSYGPPLLTLGIEVLEELGSPVNYTPE